MDILKKLKDNVMGTKEQNEEAKEGLRKYQASKDREQTKKMREPQSFGEKYALSTLRSQNKLAKEYEDIEKPKNLVEVARKGSADELRKIADRTFKSLPEEVKDYEAYKDAGFKKGGKISKAVMQNAGFYDKGKTEKERQDIVKKVTTKPQRVAMVAKAFLTKNMNEGGKVGSASKRADGIALRGKTRA